MLLSAPSLPAFLLIPFLVALPVALFRKQLGGWFFAWGLTLIASILICFALNILEAGYGATGTSIAAGLIMIQYLPLSLAAVALWMGADKAARALRRL